MDKDMDRQMDRRTDRQMGRQMDGQTGMLAYRGEVSSEKSLLKSGPHCQGDEENLIKVL